MTRPRLVFLCVHNAGRSQMAAAFARHLGGDAVEVFSGGSDPATEVNPDATAVMTEVGIDLSAVSPQAWTDEMVRTATVVVTMGCGDTCPYFAEVRYDDWEISDPSGRSLDDMREVRDEIRGRVEALLRRLGAP